MKRVYQDQFGSEGNCFEACLGSLLEVPLAEVLYLNPMPGYWFQNITDWLKEKHGLLLIPVIIPPDYPEGCLLDIFLKAGAYYILCGKSPRNVAHACVAQYGKILHDPHPSGAGLVEEEEAYFLVRP